MKSHPKTLNPMDLTFCYHKKAFNSGYTENQRFSQTPSELRISAY